MEFLDFCERITCIEDLIVIAYGYIHSEFNTAKEHQYKPTKYPELQDVISIFFDMLKYDEMHALQALKSNIKELYLKENFGFFHYYCIIRTIDFYYSYVNQSAYMGFGKFNKYRTLCKIFDEPNIVVIPKCNNNLINIFNKALKEKEELSSKKNIGLRKTLPYDKNNINAYLKNLILLHKEDIKEEIIIYEYLSSRFQNDDFIKKIINRKSIKIVLIPITSKAFDEIFQFETDDKNFWIKQIKKEEEIKIAQLYIDVIKYYSSKDVDFIVFPEMFLNKNILEKVRIYLESHSIEKEQMYILGSEWEDFSNKMVVITSEGEIVYEQYKRIPFEKGDLEEKLLEIDNIINIIDFSGVGRINTFICRDITDDKLMSIPKIVGTNLIIAPAYTQSLNMKQIVKSLAANNICTTILVNSCSARYDANSIKKKKEIGFICQHLKNGTESDCKVVNYKFDGQCKECNFNCYGFLIEIKYDELLSSQEKTFATKISKISSNNS